MITLTSIVCTCGAAPVQYEGVLSDGKFLYFRSRWEHWECGIGPTMDDAVEATILIYPPDHLWVQRAEVEGGPFAASHLSGDEARKIIDACVAEYERAKGEDQGGQRDA